MACWTTKAVCLPARGILHTCWTSTDQQPFPHLCVALWNGCCGPLAGPLSPTPAPVGVVGCDPAWNSRREKSGRCPPKPAGALPGGMAEGDRGAPKPHWEGSPTEWSLVGAEPKLTRPPAEFGLAWPMRSMELVSVRSEPWAKSILASRSEGRTHTGSMLIAPVGLLVPGPAARAQARS